MRPTTLLLPLLLLCSCAKDKERTLELRIQGQHYNTEWNAGDGWQSSTDWYTTKHIFTAKEGTDVQVRVRWIPGNVYIIDQGDTTLACDTVPSTILAWLYDGTNDIGEGSAFLPADSTVEFTATVPSR